MTPAHQPDEEKIERLFRKWQQTFEKAYPKNLTPEETVLFHRLYFRYIRQIWEDLSCDDGPSSVSP